MYHAVVYSFIMGKKCCVSRCSVFIYNGMKCCVSRCSVFISNGNEVLCITL